MVFRCRHCDAVITYSTPNHDEAYATYNPSWPVCEECEYSGEHRVTPAPDSETVQWLGSPAKGEQMPRSGGNMPRKEDE